MWRVRGPWFDLWSLFGTIFGSIGVVWVVVGMSISRFWLNLVHEVGWFGFLETHEAWIFFVWSNRLKRGVELFLYALGKRDFD